MTKHNRLLKAFVAMTALLLFSARCHRFATRAAVVNLVRRTFF